MSEWISVDEPPIESKMVRVGWVGEDKTTDGFFESGRLHEGKPFDWFGVLKDGDIWPFARKPTHWYPLLEPPK